MRLSVDTEYGVLQSVLVHRPGEEIERLTHDNMRTYLFEDIPFLRRMRAEHDKFVDRMRSEGIEVVYVERYLEELVQDEVLRRQVVVEVCKQAGVARLADDLSDARAWDPQALVSLLYCGLRPDEYADRLGRSWSGACDAEGFVLTPIPNAYFTRDPAVVVRDVAISCNMLYAQRRREALLTRAVLERHRDFCDHEVAFGGTGDATDDERLTIEGGDVLVLSPEALLVGDSERTKSESIQRLAERLFAGGRMKRVYSIRIPSDRAFMHLDTVFTILAPRVVLWYGQVMDDLEGVDRYEPGASDEGVTAVRHAESRTLQEVLAAEFGGPVTVIRTAGGRPHFAAREQRADGTNAFAIAPNVAITYERNERTNEALRAHGVRCINIDDSELVRGLGGPRCMTMPLCRST